MKIGIFTHNYPKSNDDRKNAGVFVNDFAKKLATKHSVFVFCPGDKDLTEERDGVVIHWFGWNGTSKKLGDWRLFSPLSLLFFIKLIWVGSKKAIDFAKDNKLDYCLAAWSLPSAIFTYWVKRRLGIKYGVWNLGSDINFYSKIPVLKQIIYLSLINADNLFANSYYLSDEVNCLTGKKCVFLPSVTEFVQDSNVDPVRNNKIPTFLYVGRLEKVKGPDLLIEACRAVKLAGIDFRLHVLGGGSMLTRLKKVTKKYSITSNVFFEGWADKEKVVDFMKKSDILIIPSRNESFPLILIEAAKFNLPVVVSRVGDCSRVVKKYNIGLSFETGNIIELAGIMIDFARTSKINIDRKGFAKMLETYSLDKSVLTFEEGISK